MLKNEKGSTLAFCVIIVCMLSVFVVGIGTVLTMSRKQKVTELAEEKGFYLTDSCIAITEAVLHDKASEAVFSTLVKTNEQVPVTYTGPDGSTLVFDKNTFRWLYINQAMKIFSATVSNITGDVLARDIVQFIADDTDSNYHTDPISSPALTAALAQPGTSADGYTIVSEIEENTFFGNFAKVYNTCYPSRVDTGERTYLTDPYGNLFANPDDEFFPGTPLDDDDIKELEDELNGGLLRVIYTVYDKDGTMREKVRVAYSFDMYHPLINISESQADRIYPEKSSGDDSGSSPSSAQNLTMDLKINVTREYLKS